MSDSIRGWRGPDGSLCDEAPVITSSAFSRLSAFLLQQGTFDFAVMDNRPGQRRRTGIPAPRRLNWETSKAGELSLVAQALIIEDDVFWANRARIVTARENPMLTRLWEHTLLELGFPAIMGIAVRTAFGRIGGVILTPKSAHQTDLSAQYAAFGPQFASLAREFMLEDFDGDRQVSSGLQGVLSPREVQCIRLIAMGQTDDEIANNMTIARTTVRYHFSNLCEKLGASSRANAVYRAATLGLLPSAA